MVHHPILTVQRDVMIVEDGLNIHNIGSRIFVRASVCREKLKLTYSFDNRKIIANLVLSHCCRFGKCGL